MTVFQAIVLGIVQGLSEFLPISSSAHLRLTPWLLGWPEPGLAFDVALHVGTLIALVWFFWQEWVTLFKAFVGIVRKRRVETESERRFMFVALATIPGAAAGYFLRDLAEDDFRNPVLNGVMLIVMGAILWAVDRYAKQERGLPQMTLKQAMIIGVAQMFAIIPGVSRSGSTITAGAGRGLQPRSSGRVQLPDEPPDHHRRRGVRGTACDRERHHRAAGGWSDRRRGQRMAGDRRAAQVHLAEQLRRVRRVSLPVRWTRAARGVSPRLIRAGALSKKENL
jgi:undecaprenyl-diphosphatase UppP